MKILLITDNHTPSGGAENYFFELKERLKATNGIEVYSISFGPHEQSGADYFVFKGTSSNFAKLFWRFVSHPIMYWKLKRKIKEIKPDVIHIHNIKQYTCTLLSAIKHHHVIQTIHDHGIICPTAQNIHQDLKPCPTGLRLSCFWQHQVKYGKLAYLLLACSFLRVQRLQKKIVKRFLTPSPLLANYLLQNGFHDAVYVPPFRKNKPILSSTNIHPHEFLFAGNLGNHKGVNLLIAEFARACQKNPNLILHIAGSGPEEAHMRAQVESLELNNNIIFHGWQSNLEPLYERCIALIFTSIGLEGFPLVLIDAMTYGRPVIGVNRGTTAWLVEDGKSGFLFDPLIPGDMANKVLSLTGNIDLARQLGIHGHSKINQLIDNDNAMSQILLSYQLH